MPTNTPNLAIPKPTGAEIVSRASFDNIWNVIDANAIPNSKIGTGANQIPTRDASGKLVADVLGGTEAAKYQTKGAANTDVNLNFTLDVEIDTRTTQTTYDGAGRLSKVDLLDGTTVVYSATVTYDATTGRMSTVVEAAGGKTITYTITYTAAGKVDKITKGVA